MLYRQIGYFFWGLSLSQNNKVGGYPVGVVGVEAFCRTNVELG